MAIIPPDAALRLRADNDVSLSPITPLRALATDLGSLTTGQRFSARIQQVLPDNSYRALVDGKEITLSLPETAVTGDTLELVVVERNPRMLLARLATGAQTAAKPAIGETVAFDGNAELSPAGQMIGKLLLPAGEQPKPVMLNQGVPLLAPPLPAPENLAAALAPRLEQAASQSGLFYEAHQARWISGQHSTESLMAEPQARHAVIQGTRLPVSATAAEPGHKAAVAAEGSGSPGSGINRDLMQSIPAELRPLVQQQLDAAATQRLSWHGEVWPGQTMQWQISREAPEREKAGAGETGQWNTTLALTTPGLGRIQAALGISGNIVRIRLVADSSESVPKLKASLAHLHDSLEAAGLKPVLLQVQDGDA